MTFWLFPIKLLILLENSIFCLCVTKNYFVHRQFYQNNFLRKPELWPTSRIIRQRLKTRFKNVDEAQIYDIIYCISKKIFIVGEIDYVC